MALPAFAVLGWSTSRTVPFGDGGELIAAADCLGVAHPPGYPLYTALGWLALQVPLGEPAFRMNLLSALFGALACGVLAVVLLRATGSRSAAAAALALAFSSTFWSVATVAEVYTLHVLLMALVLAGAQAAGTGTDRGARSRGVILAGVALGLGLAHHPTIVLALPAAVALALRRTRGASGSGGWLTRLYHAIPDVPERVWGAGALAALVIPVGLSWSLMLRSRLDPPSNWGRPDDFGTLVAHVTAAAYRHLDLGWAGLVRLTGWERLGEALTSQWTVLGVLVAAVAFVPLGDGRRMPAGEGLRAAAAVLVLLGGAFGLRYATDDLEVFFLPAIVGLVLAMGAGVGRLRASSSPGVRAAGMVTAILIAVVPAAVHGEARNLSAFRAADQYARDVLGTVPDGGVLFVETDEFFPAQYRLQVLGDRPDLTVYDRNGTLHRDLLDEMDLPRNPGEPPRAYRVRAEQTFIDRELARPTGRDVYFLGWPGYEAPPEFRVEPVGLLYRVCRADEPVRDDAPLWRRYHEAEVRESASRLRDPFAEGVAATYPLARGERALFRGDLDEATARFEEAAALAPRTSGIHNYIGTQYGKAGDYDRAVRAFERALAIKPTSTRAWNNLAKAHAMAGRREEAAAAWRRSLEIDPRQPDVARFLRETGS